MAPARRNMRKLCSPAASGDGNRWHWANRPLRAGQQSGGLLPQVDLPAGKNVVDQPLATLGHEIQQQPHLGVLQFLVWVDGGELHRRRSAYVPG